MNIRKNGLLLLAGISMLALAGCGEEQGNVVQAQEPPATAEPQPAPGDRTDDALQRMREGAGSILQGAEELGQQARERGERLLEDAGPALERLRELARDIGTSLNEITERAMRDFQAGVEALERRLDGVNETSGPDVADPASALPPQAQLRADTRAAARAADAGVGPGYVGVWAGDAASCGRIDAEPVEIMAVITPTTIRQHESVCNFPETPMSGGPVTVSASCIAEGDLEDREIGFTMADDDTLTISRSGSEGARLVRCHLQR